MKVPYLTNFSISNFLHFLYLSFFDVDISYLVKIMICVEKEIHPQMVFFLCETFPTNSPTLSHFQVFHNWKIRLLKMFFFSIDKRLTEVSKLSHFWCWQNISVEFLAWRKGYFSLHKFQHLIIFLYVVELFEKILHVDMRCFLRKNSLRDPNT